MKTTTARTRSDDRYGAIDVVFAIMYGTIVGIVLGTVLVLVIDR